MYLKISKSLTDDCMATLLHFCLSLSRAACTGARLCATAAGQCSVRAQDTRHLENKTTNQRTIAQQVSVRNKNNNPARSRLMCVLGEGGQVAKVHMEGFLSIPNTGMKRV